MEQNEQQMRRTEAKSGQEVMRLRSERRAGPFPRRKHATISRDALAREQAEEGGEGVWHPEELHPDQEAIGWRTRIASQPLVPREAVMRPLRPGKDRWRQVWAGLAGRADLDFHALVAQELHAGAAMLSATPVSPAQGSRSYLEGMQQHTDSTRLSSRRPVPLTLLSPPAGATVSYPGGVDQPQPAIRFAALFGRAQRLALWTAQGAIGLLHKILPREATSFPGRGDSGWAIARAGGCLLQRGGKFGGAQRSRRELMAQFETEVPDPLTEDLPGFLPARGVTTPAVGILLLVFIGKSRFKGATMQIERDDIGGRARLLGEG